MSNQPPLPNPSPKERFMQVANDVHRLREVMVNDSFERGSDLAMLQHMARCCQGVQDDESAKLAGYKIAGALEYQLTLRMLGETPVVRKAPVSDNLQS